MLVKEALEKSQLEKINIENLKQGKDSEGNDMPRYQNPDYANFKTSINPRNRGFWDLRLHGEYYKGIEARITATVVFFRQQYSNPKISWLHERLVFNGENRALGITDEQLIDAQMKNKPIIRKSLDRIINNGG